jgi:hypothetical protein
MSGYIYAHLFLAPLDQVRTLLEDGPTPTPDELRAVLSNALAQVLILQRQVNNLQADILTLKAKGSA